MAHRLNLIGEQNRLLALERLTVVGTGPEPEFDEITKLASHMCDSPMAAVTLVDHEQVWFKSTHGFSMVAMARDGSFCDWTISDEATLVVPDASGDPRFDLNHLVSGPTEVQACAAVALRLPSGHAVGTLSVFDHRPRDFTPNELASLQTLGRQVLAQLTLRDMSNRRAETNAELQKARKWIATRSNMDELTGLLSRRGITAEIERLRSTFDGPMGVLLCDVDRFKLINNSLGEAAGDSVLRIVAERVRVSLRSDDIIGRVGADEFVVFLPGIESADLEMIADRLRANIEQPIPVTSPPLRITASIGTAIEPTAELSADRLHLNADTAMYRVKALGGGQVRNAGVTAKPTGEQPLDFESEQFVRNKLAERELEMYYQPLVEATSYEIVGYEALLRWTGDAPPGLNVQRFINIAEEIGLMADLGSYVLAEGCRAAARWQDAQPGVQVSINVSPSQLVPDFVDQVDHELVLSGLAPGLLKVEITESSSVHDLELARTVVGALHGSGVRVSLDDFGTGFASMAQLVEFPFDEVKVDRSFCSSEEPSAIAVIRASVSLAHSLGASVVAEGIETEKERERIGKLGVDTFQGYLFGRPAPEHRRVTSAVTEASAA